MDPDCPVCHIQYDTKTRRPSLTPPCLHTSCSACLRDLALRGGGQYGATGMNRDDDIPVDRMISCPQCQAVVNTNDIYSDKALMAKLKQKRIDDMPVIDELTLDDFEAALSGKKKGQPQQPHHPDPTAAPYPETPFQQPQPPSQQPPAPLQQPLQHPQAMYPQPQAPLHQPHPHSSHPAQPYLPPSHPQPMTNPGAGASAIGWGQPGAHNPFDPSLNPSYQPSHHDPTSPSAMGWSVNPHGAGGAVTAGAAGAAGAAVGLVAGTAVGTKVVKDVHGKKVDKQHKKKKLKKKEKHHRSSSSDSSSSSSSSGSRKKHHRRHRSKSASSSSSGSRKHHRHRQHARSKSSSGSS